MDKLIGGLYYEKALIGQGAFGQIFLGQNTQTKDLVAIKKETANCKNPQLTYESKVYKCLEGGMGIPKIYAQTNESGMNVMVMDLLGPSLEDMFNYCFRRFSVKTVLMLGIELLTRLEFIHHRNFIHRDIKPDNFVLGLGERANVVYVIDFGLSKKYRTPGSKQHIPYRDGKSLTGTPRYASINNHKGIEQSRRDDLESLGYVLIYFLKGRLPWQGLQGAQRREKYEMIQKTKEETSLDDLCSGLPTQIKDYMEYCRRLAFDQIPEYRYLRRLFKTALEERKMKNDGVYDWINSTERFDSARLPKHCLNSSGQILEVLKHPAPAEYREMYKEEAYRQKTTPGISDPRAHSISYRPGVYLSSSISSAYPSVSHYSHLPKETGYSNQVTHATPSSVPLPHTTMHASIPSLPSSVTTRPTPLPPINRLPPHPAVLASRSSSNLRDMHATSVPSPSIRTAAVTTTTGASTTAVPPSSSGPMRSSAHPSQVSSTRALPHAIPSSTSHPTTAMYERPGSRVYTTSHVPPSSYTRHPSVNITSTSHTYGERNPVRASNYIPASQVTYKPNYTGMPSSSYGPAEQVHEKQLLPNYRK